MSGHTDPITKAARAWWKRVLTIRLFYEKLGILKPIKRKK